MSMMEKAAVQLIWINQGFDNVDACYVTIDISENKIMIKPV